MQPIRSEMKELQQKTKSIREDRNAQYRQVLTADQYARFQEMQERRRHQETADHGAADKRDAFRRNAANGNRGGGTEARPSR
jgi:diphthamide synthase subunit DPH2